MNFLGKITSKVVKQPAKPQLAPELLALQKASQNAFKQNLDNVAKGLPEVVKGQQDAMKGLSALSEQIKATLPK